jgi:hypothetical protein
MWLLMGPLETSQSSHGTTAYKTWIQGWLYSLHSIRWCRAKTQTPLDPQGAQSWVLCFADRKISSSLCNSDILFLFTLLIFPFAKHLTLDLTLLLLGRRIGYKLQIGIDEDMSWIRGHCLTPRQRYKLRELRKDFHWGRLMACSCPRGRAAVSVPEWPGGLEEEVRRRRD